MKILVFMQFVLEMETKVGYILTASVAAIALTAIYMKYIEAQGERKRASNSLNKVILLQNRVKIRYVNNTNLLDYLYMKFEIKSAKDLAAMWEQYLSEKEERARMKEAMKELSFSQEQLVHLLRKYRLHDPLIWLHQTEAILDPKEMVEVRHALITRRQKLRKQMEFNTKNAEQAQQQVRELVGEYPQYAKEILQMVSDYE
jgi:ABC-type lipoprotein export system ATPase subunit